MLALLSIWLAAYIYAAILAAPGISVAAIVVAAALLSIAFIATTDAPNDATP